MVHDQSSRVKPGLYTAGWGLIRPGVKCRLVELLHALINESSY